MVEALGPCELKSLLVRHLPLIIHVCKVSNQVDHNVWCRVVADLPQPLVLNVFKALATRDIEDQEDAVTALVKVARDRSE